MTMDPVDVTRLVESTAGNTFRLSETPPLFVRGEGPFLFTRNGQKYIDLVCGSATTLLGHGHPAQTQAIQSVLNSGILHTGTRLPSEPRALLYQRLLKHLPPGVDTIHLANSGAEAIETALKAAMHVTGRKRFVAFERGYHGRTLGALALTHAQHLRAPFEPWETPWVDFAPYAERDEEADTTLERLEALLKAAPYAAVVIEAVQGVSGVRGPSAVFLEGVERLTKQYGALLILDEIWSGLGRSGRWFAFQHANLTPDMIVLGKGLSASLPLSAVASRADILKSWDPGTHTSTFQGNPLACAAAAATLQTLEDDALIPRAENTLAPMMRRAFAGRRGLRVVGAQCALDLGSPQAVAQLQSRAMDDGILVYASGQSLMVLPPLNIDEDVFEDTLSRLRRLVDT